MLRRWAALIALSALLLVGCGRSSTTVDVSRLEITRYRLNVDDRHGFARVFAEATNAGEDAVKQAVVSAQLLGPGDDQYEGGFSVLDNIRPGEARPFSIRIDATGRERDVEFTILAPDDPAALELTEAQE